jgi:hypothetical protein
LKLQEKSSFISHQYLFFHYYTTSSSVGKKFVSDFPRIFFKLEEPNNDDPIIAEYRKYGFNGVVTKPYKYDELNEVLARIISTKY